MQPERRSRRGVLIEPHPGAGQNLKQGSREIARFGHRRFPHFTCQRRDECGIHAEHRKIGIGRDSQQMRRGQPRCPPSVITRGVPNGARLFNLENPELRRTGAVMGDARSDLRRGTTGIPIELYTAEKTVELEQRVFKPCVVAAGKLDFAQRFLRRDTVFAHPPLVETNHLHVGVRDAALGRDRVIDGSGHRRT